ncbi:MAG: helix-turn-helix domain-containing protein [Proteobacteria bacterium]|nr:helix-turn-helix domain-containing protein [Pseudomonadota bacterium]
MEKSKKAEISAKEEHSALGLAIIEGLSEVKDYYLKRNQDKVRVSQRQKSELIALRPYSAREIKEIRTRFNMTQEYFAEVMGVGVDAVRKWEQKGGIKTGPAIRMLQQIVSMGGVPDQTASQPRGVLRP